MVNKNIRTKKQNKSRKNKKLVRKSSKKVVRKTIKRGGSSIFNSRVGRRRLYAPRGWAQAATQEVVAAESAVEHAMAKTVTAAESAVAKTATAPTTPVRSFFARLLHR